ncbi:MAG: hypothetical protein Q8928_11705 [Bacteroidota bacterium]|nr:hypothetical protein [Bacteroidota bacterium]
MNKKSLEKKFVKQFILEGRNCGKTDQEIYNELTEQYYDKKSIVLLITGTATKEDKAKYKSYNNILLGVLGLIILLKILMVFSLTVETGELWTLLFVFLVPIFSGYFMFEIARYNAPIYRACGILAIAGFLQTVGKLEGGVDILLNVFFAGLVCGLSFYLDNKLFPNYSPKNLRKNKNGDYIL